MRTSKLANIVLTFFTLYALNNQINKKLIEHDFTYKQKPSFILQDYNNPYRTDLRFVDSLIENLTKNFEE